MSELSYNELRKGNLLYFPFISGNVEVIGINAMYGANDHYFNKLSVMEGINMYYEPIEVFKPIPLTEEWLIKFGFLKYAGLYELNTGDFELIYNEDHISLDVEGQWLTLGVYHVHQLQNLFFALTGKELQQTNN